MNQKLFTNAGLNSVEIKVEQTGSYISLEQAKKMYVDPNHPAPGQYPHPLAKLSTVDLKQIKQEFEHELEALETDRGIWNNISTFYIYGYK